MKYKQNITPQQLIELGKIPPQALDIEEAVLGAMMLDKEGLENALEIIKPDAFYKEAHQEICKAIFSLKQKNRGDSIDILTTTQELLKLGTLDIAGGAHYVTKLTNNIASASNIQVHCRIILEKYYKREIIRIATETVQKAYDDTTDVFELINSSSRFLSEIDNSTAKTIQTFAESLNASAIALSERIEAFKHGRVIGIPTGLTDLDKFTGGWKKKTLVILAARPGRGKSALVIHFIKSAARLGKPSALFSLEMENINITDRAILGETAVNSYNYRDGDLQHYQLEHLKSKEIELAKLPIYLDDTPSLSIFELRKRIKRLVRDHKVVLVGVDYLQLMTVPNEKTINNRENEVAYISKNLKSIAKEFNVCIIALSQFSRDVEKRGGSMRPKLSDLRESGAIEQDADIVIFIYYPHKDGITSEDGRSLVGEGELIIEKHRNGDTGSVFYGCNKSMTIFYDRNITENHYK